MKKFIPIIFSFSILLLACSPRPDIRGVWMGAYRLEDEPIEFGNSMRILLDFNEDTIEFVELELQEYGDRDTVESGTYKLRGHWLILSNGTEKVRLKIDRLSQDSMVLVFKSESRPLVINKSVFKRIKSQSSPKYLSLVGKAFEMTIANGYRDTIEFMNDSIVLYLGNMFNTYRTENWDLIEYRDYNFLVMDHYGSPPLLVQSNNDSVVGLEMYGTKVWDVKLKEIDIKMDTSYLLGKWVEVIVADGLPLSPPPPGIEDTDSRRYLEFTKDSLVRTYYGRSWARSWALNQTNKFIYYPDRSLHSYKTIRIEKLSRDMLVLENFNGAYTSTDQWAKTVFIREE